MRWYHYIAYFVAGAFLANAIPHFVNGISGNAFQSPFASPPGIGLSSSTVNVLWGFFNFAIGYLLVFRVGTLRFAQDTACAHLRFRHPDHVDHACPRIRPVSWWFMNSVWPNPGLTRAYGGLAALATAGHPLDPCQ